MKPLSVRVDGYSNAWLFDVLKDSDFGNDVKFHESLAVKEAYRNGLCVVCKGSRFLCGKARCPIIVRANYFLKSITLMQSEEVAGVSPPSVFVGRIGYPYVYAGPLVPPVREDTSIYDLPEFWFGNTIDEIVGFRSLLIRGKCRVHVKKFEEAGKIIEKTRELAFAVNPVDVELMLKKKPRGFIVLDDEVQPFGPAAPIQNMLVGNTRWDHQIEKAHYDTGLRAAEAVMELYGKGVLVTKIQRAFSVGAFGLKNNRRLVPTRWSITAVDSIISKQLMEKIKTFPEICEYRVYESRYLDNVFEVIMIPGAWSYESIEAWYPGTVWNPSGKNAVIYSDWEGYDGRTTYADIGGCYYAARLAVCEQLVKERMQATVIVLREARPGYIMPVGVWQVRENVRNAMRQKPLTFKTLDETLKWVASRFQIPVQQWIMQSELLKNALFQKKITDFLTRQPKV
ncbi:MAG: Nre family DNA repair protein [Candidatus Bathyarchaeia archaeon]